jgi:hypothetical protein
MLLIVNILVSNHNGGILTALNSPLNGLGEANFINVSVGDPDPVGCRPICRMQTYLPDPEPNPDRKFSPDPDPGSGSDPPKDANY